MSPAPVSVVAVAVPMGTEDRKEDNPVVPRPSVIPVPDPSRRKEKSVNSLAMYSCCLGILSCFFFSILFGPCAIYLGCKAKDEIKENPDEFTGECQANFGIIISILAIIFWIVALIFYLNAV